MAVSVVIDTYRTQLEINARGCRLTGREGRIPGLLSFKSCCPGQVVVWHAFHPSTQEATIRGISEFEASLINTANSRRASATQRNPILKKYGDDDNDCYYYYYYYY